MKQRAWILRVAALLAAGAIVSACSNIRKLAESDPEPEVNMRQPNKSKQPVPAPAADTAVKPTSVIVVGGVEYRAENIGERVTDEETGEDIMSKEIEAVTISAPPLRNVVERNGQIYIEFIVTVPAVLQDNNWQLVVCPEMQKGPDTMRLAPLVYTGDRFRAMQEHEYGRFDQYRNRIVEPTDYFEHFADKRAYKRYMEHVARERIEYSDAVDRLQYMTPEQTMFDRKVGWTTPKLRKRQYEKMRRYVLASDRTVLRNLTYVSDTDDKFDHLKDYLTPRYRYDGVENLLPGGEIFTRVDGEYPVDGGRARETYIRSLRERPGKMRTDVEIARDEELRRMSAERLAWTGLDRPAVSDLLAETSDSSMFANYRRSKEDAYDQLSYYYSTDTAAVRRSMLHPGMVARNERLEAGSEDAFRRLVRHPYYQTARLDTVIYRPDSKIDYYYTERIQADENTTKMKLYLTGSVEDRNGRRYDLVKSDTLTYNVTSMAEFLDTQTRYVQQIITRDAEANERFFFTFPRGKSSLVDTLPENRSQIRAVRQLTSNLMTDPVYIIDSITLRATSSPEGTWTVNARLARERAEALRRVLVSEFRVLYDSLKVLESVTLDDAGNIIVEEKDKDSSLPDLPNLLRATSLAEDWDEVKRLISADTVIRNKEEIFALIDAEPNPDIREYRIRAKYPQDYARMRAELYPQMRAVDFRFNLHRRGQKLDTVYTTVVDTNYMRAVDLLKKRRYEAALRIFQSREIEDRNTALAYMSLGFDRAAYRILKALPGAEDNADTQYMLAIEAARLGDDESAVRYFLRAVELRPSHKWRGNKDPEISRLVSRYGLFKEDWE